MDRIYLQDNFYNFLISHDRGSLFLILQATKWYQRLHLPTPHNCYLVLTWWVGVLLLKILKGWICWRIQVTNLFNLCRLSQHDNNFSEEVVMWGLKLLGNWFEYFLWMVHCLEYSCLIRDSHITWYSWDWSLFIVSGSDRRSTSS